MNELANSDGRSAASDPHRTLTDAANARRFVAQHGCRLRWVLSEKHWLLWDRCRWRAAAGEEIEAFAKETAATIWNEVTSTPVSNDRMEISRHAKFSESARAVAAMVWLARSEPAVTVHRADLDRNPFLFNCLNCTIDLQQHTISGHQPADLITKVASVAYDRNAQCPTWLRFLLRVMNGSWDLVSFLQRAVGYSLSGNTSEQRFFLLYGLGANGKSTFVETIRALLGDYARHADSTTFLAQRGDSARQDVARLAGARFVSAAEVPAGRAMDETLMKQLTGGGTVTARYLYRPEMEFVPQCKIWIEGNHRPEIRGVDHANWRRVILVPFEVTIPEAERDPDLWGKLRDELPGILNWARAGFSQWQERGLALPGLVRDAVDDYRTATDPLADFIAEVCFQDGAVTIPKDDLYRWYAWWCGERRMKPLTKQTFGISIAERGIQQERTSAVRYWKGIGIRPGAGGDTR